MQSLGIKSQAKDVCFVIVQKNNKEYTILNNELIKIPITLNNPLKLKYIRNTVLDILTEYNISVAGIRIIENNSKNVSINRIQIEGVIQECFASSDVKSYFTGQMLSISRKICIDKNEYKKITTDKEAIFDKLKNWHLCKDLNSKEAALVALGAFR